MPVSYPFDSTGAAATNLVTGEIQTISPTLNTYNVVVPKAAPYYSDSLIISLTDLSNNTRVLVEGIDYHKSHQYIGASRSTAKSIYGSFTLLNHNLSGVANLRYQTLGGEWVVDAAGINTVLSDLLRNPRTTSWEQVRNLPTVFPPTPHQWDLTDMVGEAELVSSIASVANAIANRANTTPVINLPVQTITKHTVGLGMVDNFSTANDLEAVGNSATRFMTPRGTRLSISAALSAYDLNSRTKYHGVGIPTTGHFNKGDYVVNDNVVLLQWHSDPTTPVEGMSYVIRGWIRMTSGSTHTLNVDWVEDRCLTG